MVLTSSTVAHPKTPKNVRECALCYTDSIRIFRSHPYPAARQSIVLTGLVKEQKANANIILVSHRQIINHSTVSRFSNTGLCQQIIDQWFCDLMRWMTILTWPCCRELFSLGNLSTIWLWWANISSNAKSISLIIVSLLGCMVHAATAIFIHFAWRWLL